MKIASQEIRTAAIKAYDSGVPPQQIAETLGYSLNSINRWLREYQKEGRLKALPRGHRISMFSEEERKQLVELLEKRPDMTLDEIRTHFDKQCSLNAVHKIVKALGFVFKKTLRAKEQERADIVRTRQRWKIFQQIEHSTGFSRWSVQFFTDVGAGTIDQSVFTYAGQEGERKVNFFAGKVFLHGSRTIEITACRGNTTAQNLEHWRRKKEEEPDDKKIESIA